jgi:hypothetical protein
VLDPVDVQQQLTLEEQARLIVIWVQMKRGPLAPGCGMLQQNERASRLFCRHLEADKAASEPDVVAYVLRRDHRRCPAHPVPPRLTGYHHESQMLMMGTFVP